MRYSLIALLLILALVVAAVRAKQVSDDKIYDEVRRRLANDVDVKGGGLDVTVKDGVVTLQRHVNDKKRKRKSRENHQEGEGRHQRRQSS